MCFLGLLKSLPRSVVAGVNRRVQEYTWEFPKVRSTLFGGPEKRIPLFRVLYYGPLFSETPTYTLHYQDLLRLCCGVQHIFWGPVYIQ